MPTYILLRFYYYFFKLKKRSHSTVPLNVWVPSKLDGETISGCLQQPFDFFFSTPNFVQPKALKRLVLKT